MTRPTITDEQLIAFAAGELTGQEAARVESRLATDAEAARLVALYRRVRERMNEDDAPEPPAETLARAKALFARRPTESGPGWLERLQSVIATLVYDSRLQPAAVRYDAADDRLQLTYETEEASIDLQAQRQEPAGTQEVSKRWRLIGQVSSDSELEEGLEAALLPAGGAAPIAVVEADERLIFTLDVESGLYDLRVRFADVIIVLPGIEIQ
jgi:anti-sigma factor RsiW